MSPTAQIGVTGLAVMGRNLARNLARNDYTVAVHNRSTDVTSAFVDEFGAEGAFIPATSAKGLVDSLDRPRRLLVMVKAGEPTDAVITEFARFLEPGDVVIDGGNAHFADTRRREARLHEQGIHFIGAGISGGEEGALHGPSIMPGGSEEAYRAVGALLEKIAARTPDGSPAVAHIGPDGAGHFVKMVHNGIEYADMQLIAEAYDLLRHVAGHQPDAIAEIFGRWSAGRLDAYLTEMTGEVLAHTDVATGRPFVDIVADEAGQKGTGRWTVQTALDLGVPVSGIAEAVFSRALSGLADQRRAARILPGPVRTQLHTSDVERFTQQVEQALYASKVVAYAQGWHMIRTASDEFGWHIDLGTVAGIWRAGSIVRASFLDRIAGAYTKNPHLPGLLADEEFAREIAAAQYGWRTVVAAAARDGVPAPGFAAALAYYDSLRAERLPTALVQGQRDYFGAHTYRRVDRDGAFHTTWSADRSEHRTG
ncbi:NADP-dependent phosphogluconate dehydrogenase [Streptomyces sp. NPDC059169]|uniref:NADP-dependent phosphogluconate dehydrogenase n=1 Tax=Streptomyces sp. NPDC059169 TaxID=3346754 RepID=UPI0036AD9FD7